MDGVTNFGKVTVSTGYNDSATSIVLSTGHGNKLPDPSIANYNLVWWNSTDYPDPADDPNVEIVRCTAKTDDTLTISRGQEDTTPSNKNTSGRTYKMILALTKKTIDDIDTEAQDKVDTHALLTATHGVDHIAGLNEDGGITLTSTKSQVVIRNSINGGSTVITGDSVWNTFNICNNCEWDGTNWNRISTTHQAIRIETIVYALWFLTPTQRIYIASAGSNPISSWDLVNGAPIMNTHRIEDVSSVVHPNANTHINASAPHSGHELLSNKNASNGYPGLTGGRLADSQMPGILNKYAIGNNVIHSHDAEVYTSSVYCVKIKEITISSLYKTPSTLRISFEMKRAGDGVGAAHGQIYKNGSSFGTIQSNSFGSYATFTEDLSFEEGDTLELWIWQTQTDPIQYAYARNLRIKGGSAQVTLAEAINESSVGLATPYVFTNTYP